MKLLKVLKERGIEQPDFEQDLRGFSNDPILTDSRFEAVLICEINEMSVAPDMLAAFGVTQSQVLDDRSRYRAVFRRKGAHSGSHGQDALYLLGFGQVLLSHQPELKLHLRLVDGVRASIVANGVPNFLDKQLVHDVSQIEWKSSLELHATVEPFVQAAHSNAPVGSNVTLKLVRDKSR